MTIIKLFPRYLFSTLHSLIVSSILVALLPGAAIAIETTKASLIPNVANKEVADVALIPYPTTELAQPPTATAADQTIIDYALAPTKPLVAILVTQDNRHQILFWDLNKNSISKKIDLAREYRPISIVWHPVAERIFMVAKSNNNIASNAGTSTIGAISQKQQQSTLQQSPQSATYHILVAHASNNWQPQSIYQSATPLSHLVVAPRPLKIDEPDKQGNERDNASTTSTGTPINNYNNNYKIKYRLFFAVHTTAVATIPANLTNNKITAANKTSTTNNVVVQSITEDGSLLYQVIGKETAAFNQSHLSLVNYGEPPSALTVQQMQGNYVPLDFHPAGHLLALKNDNGCIDLATYVKSWQAELRPLHNHTATAFCNHPSAQLHHSTNTNAPTNSFAFLPNGLGILRWTPDHPGLEIYFNYDNAKKIYFPELTFKSQPRLAPDARGIVATIANPNTQQTTLIYKPINIPLGDVTNAWMFVTSPEEQNLFSTNAGMMRPQNADAQQIYQLYDTELYSCGNPMESQPTRPYIITTDAFWEVFAAAFEGTFILIEREIAIPYFWQFVSGANQYYTTHAPHSSWAKVFAVLEALKPTAANNQKQVTITATATSAPSKTIAIAAEVAQEVELIKQASGQHGSAIIAGANVNYAELKPRSHYQATPELATYFKAFKYLTLITGGQNQKTLDINEMQKLPQNISNSALQWVKSYLPFISSTTRTPIIFGNNHIKISPYAYDPNPIKPTRFFPLSWGFDNETIARTTFHSDWSSERQITGSHGPRLLPSALDIAAATGSSFAQGILEHADEFKKYPTLQKAIDDLRIIFNQQKASFPASNLYDQWLNALAIQWADNKKSPLSPIGDGQWAAKRLQTGLASWTALRHATALVNERSDAECGEGGFETLLTQYPRGFVETDPETFTAIARLFAATIDVVKNLHSQTLDSNKTGSISNNTTALIAAEMLEDSSAPSTDSTVKAGVLRRLQNMQKVSLQFADMARRELKGETLKTEEYDLIVYIGRVIEHNFLVFKSLAKSDFALANPDPMSKAIDIAGVAGGAPYAIVAMGNPLEWDLIYPMLGRKMIGKGSVYAFYEFSSGELLDDNAWRQNKLNSQARPAWLQPFIYRTPLQCPAKDSL